MNEREAFAFRLKKALEDQQFLTNSPTFLCRQFNLRYTGQAISVQTASNWLSGSAIPNQDKLLLLANWLNVSSEWLRFGESKNNIFEQKQRFDDDFVLDFNDLNFKITKLTPRQQRLIHELVEVLLTEII